MPNPYAGLPDTAFWRRAVSGAETLDPVTAPRFGIVPSDRIATAGSCFAQHIARALAARGVAPLVTEDGPAARGFGVYPARFGNVYSPRQLLQLFRRAYALFEPEEEAWTRPDGRLVDPFRPQVEPEGFADPDALRADREAHLAAVRRMFERCDVLVFTLGLTEAWESRRDGAVFPLAPGVVAAPEHDEIGFRNFTVAEMVADLSAFLSQLRRVNPAVRILLTVSPVPLIATYEARHVLVSTVASKSALRVVADEITRADRGVDYFPSYEMIAGHPARGRWFERDLRAVSAEGVAMVMEVFCRHYLGGPAAPAPPARTADIPRRAAVEAAELDAIICDEEALDR
ncbi:GSCFA domain-containing protein [Falsiroseomonas sp. HW251]|uniref:GSCFA domain-containing protein n=1 Tax=Falsiroseomonas sp. HW251 TaxID=3390998 RepID=UPI003D30F46B